MLEPLTLATRADLPAIWQLYSDVCEHQAADAYSPQWTLGIYPAEEDFLDRIDAGEMMLGFDQGRLVGALALTREEDPEYVGVPWPSGATEDEVSVIHLLAVHPDARGQRLGAQLVREAIRIAREWSKRAIHLDVVPGNDIASRLYVAEGFAFVQLHEVYYEDLGNVDLEMYELAL